MICSELTYIQNHTDTYSSIQLDGPQSNRYNWGTLDGLGFTQIGYHSAWTFPLSDSKMSELRRNFNKSTLAGHVDSWILPLSSVSAWMILCWTPQYDSASRQKHRMLWNVSQVTFTQKNLTLTISEPKTRKKKEYRIAITIQSFPIYIYINNVAIWCYQEHLKCVHVYI